MKLAKFNVKYPTLKKAKKIKIAITFFSDLIAEDN